MPNELSPPTQIHSRSAMGILFAVSACHLLNDTVQALLPAIYPLLKESFSLSFTQIGLVTFTFQMVGSVLQPIVGSYTDRTPQPYSLPVGMGITLVGLIFLAMAPSYAYVMFAAAMVGLGSSVFHPEASRMARLASGGRHGFAQSLFQVGGNAGTALGPLLAAWLIVPHGQRYLLWFAVLPLLAMLILFRVGTWYRGELTHSSRQTGRIAWTRSTLASNRVSLSLTVLLVLMFSKFFYLAAMTNYYTFYLIQKFGVSVQASQQIGRAHV